MFADLVLEVGGIKGIALVGGIIVLQERGYEFRRVAGTSAGAIVGSLVAVKTCRENLAARRCAIPGGRQSRPDVRGRRTWLGHRCRGGGCHGFLRSRTPPICSAYLSQVTTR